MEIVNLNKIAKRIEYETAMKVTIYFHDGLHRFTCDNFYHVEIDICKMGTDDHLVAYLIHEFKHLKKPNTSKSN